MSDSLEKLRQNQSPGLRMLAKASLTAPASDDEEEAACASFGYLRGLRERAVKVEFRRVREGDSLAFPYHWLGPSRHHPSVGVVLLFVGTELYLVTLKGRNLNRLSEAGVSLYERGLLRERVTWIREVPRDQSDLLPQEECVVERIEVRAVTAESAAKALGLEYEAV